ncbi:hypothetical protein D3C85_1464280 [compost metagenome]
MRAGDSQGLGNNPRRTTGQCAGIDARAESCLRKIPANRKRLSQLLDQRQATAALLALLRVCITTIEEDIGELLALCGT